MSYDSREASRYDGDPIECLLIQCGGQTFRYTLDSSDTVLPSGTYVPNVLVRAKISATKEQRSQSAEITFPMTSPVAQLATGGRAVKEMLVTIFRAHRGELTDVRILFIGTVTGARITGTNVTLLVARFDTRLATKIPGPTWQAQCNWAVYDPFTCQVDRNAFTDIVTVTTVTGATIVSADFALKPDGYYAAGPILSTAGSDTEEGWCVSHVGDTVKVMKPFVDLSSGDIVLASKGCQLNRVACLEFDNLIHASFFEFAPTKNPHESRMDG